MGAVYISPSPSLPNAFLLRLGWYKLWCGTLLVQLAIAYGSSSTFLLFLAQLPLRSRIRLALRLFFVQHYGCNLGAL